MTQAFPPKVQTALIKWAITLGTLGFIVYRFRQEWTEVAALPLQVQDGIYFTSGLGITLVSFMGSGLVWSLILRQLQGSSTWTWSIQVYLITNIAKYLPGNIWHLYSRISRSLKQGVSLDVGIVSVGLELLLSLAAALMLAVLGLPALSWIQVCGQGLALGAILILIQRQWVNRFLKILNSSLSSKLSAYLFQQDPIAPPRAQLTYGPWLPFLAALIFMLLRGMGFLVVLKSSVAVEGIQTLKILGAFGLAWVLGVVVPGAPGGLGIFESVILVLLDQLYPAAPILRGVAFYRLISLMAETLAAVGAYGYNVIFHNVARSSKAS